MGRKRILVLAGAVWLLCPCIQGACPTADLTGDCVVNLEDLAAVAAEWMVDGTEIEGMVRIPAGTFAMGDATMLEGDLDEVPVHRVTLTSFFVGKYEVTNGEYCGFLNSILRDGQITVTDYVRQAGGGSAVAYYDLSPPGERNLIVYRDGVFYVRTKGGRDMNSDPAVMVTWYGAAAYCNWRSQKEGLIPCYDPDTWECHFEVGGYHLPTEAQWEYAARGGLSGKRFPCGDTISHPEANYYSWTFPYDLGPQKGYHPTWNDGTYPATAPVGGFPANGYGLHDMAGNVWEWCNDWSGSYSSESHANPVGPVDDYHRMMRGGAWSTNAWYCRVAQRHSSPPESAYDNIGFRLCLE